MKRTSISTKHCNIAPVCHLLTALLAAALCACNLYAAPIHTGGKAMSELTKTMQPVCVGRFVIEIPSVARINGWDQEVDDTKIKSIEPPSLNKKAFDTKVHHREMVLKTTRHETEGHVLKSKIQLSPDSVLFVYREDNTDTTGYNFEALFWKPGVEYLFNSSATNKYLDEEIAEISKGAKSFIAMPTTDLATVPPGLCIEHGVIIGSEFRGEHVAFSGRIDEYPGVTFSFSTQSTDKRSEDPTLIQRIDRSFGMGDEIGKKVSAATRFVRKGKRTINGQPGEEIVTIATVDGVTYMDADAEFYAEPNTLDKPFIEVSLGDQTHDDNTHRPFNKNLTEKEFLALWDSLLNGIRPRTKNQSGFGSIWGPGPSNK